jgi:dipeptidyl aminopeptidase/acylaminoacyl peptidase
VLVLPAHGDAVSVSDALAGVPLADSLRDDAVYVISAYRGQTLEVGGQTFTSPADPAAAYDLDADDAMALLDAVLEGDILVDTSRVAVAGYDRGGSAALVAAERYPGLDLVTSLAAPTDFLLPSVRQLTRTYLLGQGTFGFPALEDVAAAVIDPLRAGGGDIATARLELIRRSPSYFVAPPPFVFAAHGTLDGVVAVAHGRALAGVQGTPDSVYLELEEHDHGSILTSSEVLTTASGLFIELVRDP